MFANLETEIRKTDDGNIHYHVFHKNPDGSLEYDFYRGVETDPFRTLYILLVVLYLEVFRSYL